MRRVEKHSVTPLIWSNSPYKQSETSALSCSSGGRDETRALVSSGSEQCALIVHHDQNLFSPAVFPVDVGLT